MHALSLLTALFVATLEVPDGTLVVLENSNPVVEAYTKSEVTHVAMVMNREGVPYVYEATPKEVRELKLTEFYEELAAFNRHRRESRQLRVRLYSPKVPYTQEEIAAMKQLFEEQIGRRYSIKGYVRNRQADGIHCAELACTALEQTGRYDFEKAYAVSPARLVHAIQATHHRPVDVTLPSFEPVGSWCERSWNWWAGMFSWCGWACYETWAFCR